jgi:hypothetical protein
LGLVKREIREQSDKYEMRKLLLSIFTLLLVSCSPESNINPTIDRTGKEITIKVIFHETRQSLEDAYRIANRLDKNEPIPEQWGFARWNSWIDANGNYVDLPGGPYNCVIHTFRPKNVDDQSVLTMGHELLHCVYGTYHK